MNDLLSFWFRLSLIRRAVLLGATGSVFAAVLLLASMNVGGDKSLLYAGLDARAAGQVILALDQAAAPYEVRGDSIYVDASQRDSLRMQLAAQGLPASGGEGYELLDSLSGFGTTSQMFDAAYWRAKEGELARTALAMPNVRAARVHIAAQSASGFLREPDLAASITVTMASGGGVQGAGRCFAPSDCKRGWSDVCPRCCRDRQRKWAGFRCGWSEWGG